MAMSPQPFERAIVGGRIPRPAHQGSHRIDNFSMRIILVTLPQQRRRWSPWSVYTYHMSMIRHEDPLDSFNHALPPES